MQLEQLIVQTTVTSRQIKQAMNALLKSQAIVSAYKIPHVKYFSLDDKNKPSTHNIQLLVLQSWPKREFSWQKILDQILKDRRFYDVKV